MQRNITGILEADQSLIGKTIAGIKVLGSDNLIEKYFPDAIELANGVGSISSLVKRKATYDKFKSKGYKFSTVIHPTAIIADDVEIGEGVQIMAGVIIQTGCKIGDNTIINTGAVVEHDCIIEKHVHIAPGAVLSGGVRIGTMTHVGSSATIIQGIEIGANCLVGAGSVVIQNVPDNSKALGVPAKVFYKKESY